MSVDYFLFSRSHAKKVNVGSVGLSGTQSYPGLQEVADFIRWAIEENIKDVVLIEENHLYDIEDTDEDAERRGFALAIEMAGKVCDRVAVPDSKFKSGPLYHQHVGSTTAAFVIASTIRAITYPEKDPPI